MPFSTEYNQLEFYNYYENFLLQISLYSGNQKEQYKNQLENSYLAECNSLDVEIMQYNSELQIYKETQKKYTICAESNGVVSLNGTFTVGTLLSAGTNIGSVINQEDVLYLNAYASITDRSKINIGYSVDLAILGLSQSKYGTIKGKVVFISEDTIKSDTGAFYLIKIEIEQRCLGSKEDVVELLVGMGAEARIKYDSVSYMRYFLDQLGIKL